MIGKVSELFHRYGIKSVTMDDVSRELGISKKTLYEQFSDKSQLVKKVIEHELSCNKRKFETTENDPENALEELFLIFSYYITMLKEHYPSFEFDLRKYYPEIYSGLKAHRREKMMENAVKNIKRGKKEGLYRQDMNEEFIAKLNIIRVECLTENDIFSTDELMSHEFALEMFLYHIHGIVNEKGLSYIEKNMSKLKNIG